MKYDVWFTETINWRVSIEADSLDDAIDKWFAEDYTRDDMDFVDGRMRFDDADEHEEVEV